MSSEKKQITSQTILARIRSALYTNKKLAFLVSILLASLLYLFASVNNNSSSPYAIKRYGLGAGDLQGELQSALRRKGDGRAAVAIIRVIGMNSDKHKNDDDYNPQEDVQYLVQIKSHDYPITSFRGTVCLLGGNANKHDETPLDTLKRELKEELGVLDWMDALALDDDPTKTTTANTKVADHSQEEEAQHDDKDEAQQQQNSNSSSSEVILPPISPGTIRYLGTTLHFQSASLINKPQPYAFMCALYEITLRPEQLPPSALYPRGANIQEGRVVLLTEDQLIRHSNYAWGYEYTMEEYFGKKTANKQKGTAVSVVDEATRKETVWTPLK